MDKLKQKVLCIPTDKLFSKTKWNGLKRDDLDYYYELLLKESEFKIRGELEENINYKQIIPQVILEHEGEYFLHKQVNGTEERLNEMFPLALGGHVEEFDMGSEEDLLQTALTRELNEEVDLNAKILNRNFLGLVYIEDENPVNHVHVGLFYIFNIDGRDVHVREKELEEIGFVNLEFLKKNIDKLTFWSRVATDYLN